MAKEGERGGRSQHRARACRGHRHDEAVAQRGQDLWVLDELPIPGEGEALPLGREPAAVEGEHHEHEDGRVQEDVGERAERAQERRAPLHRPTWAARIGFRKRNRKTTRGSESRNESAEPNGMSRAIANWLWIKLPM